MIDSSPAPAARADVLRRHQRRLLLWGGGLLTALMVVAAVAAVALRLGQFHQEQQRLFLEGRQAIDHFLVQRDRAYAANINGSDTMWATQQPGLVAGGTPLVPRFVENGGQLAVLAPGERAVPWLAVGRTAQPLPDAQLAAYLGMLQHYSAFTSATVVALQSTAPSIALGYTPDGNLLAVAGLSSEAQLLQALRLPNRQALFDRLTTTWQPQHNPSQYHPVTGQTVRGQRMTSLVGTNPITGRPSLVSHAVLAVNQQPYFYRVTFEPLDGVRQQLQSAAPGAFVVTDTAGVPVVHTGIGAGVAVQHAALALAARHRAGVHWRDGHFIIASPVKGIDWVVARTYGPSEVAADQGAYWAGVAATTAALIAGLWALLLGLDRRVFGPALADAARVFESEALSRTIVDTSPLGLALLDQHGGEVIMQNHAMQHLTRHQRAQQLPLPTRLAQQLRNVGTGDAYEAQLDGEDDKGQSQQLQVTGAAARYQGQAVWVVALRDISSQVELETHLRSARRSAEQARQAAEAANRAKTAFVAATSHEIRTPLNGVLGHLELLARSPLQPEQRARVQRIRQAAETLHSMVSDVLDFSRIEAGLLDVEMAPFSLRPLLERTALLFAPQAQARGVALYLHVDPSLAERYTSDAHRLQQVLNNLVNNAVKFTHHGRVILRVEPAEGPGPAPWLRFTVEDSGIGISPAQQARLFQPFAQADASVSRDYGGSGLGLALCRQLTHLLGGTIAVHSAVGQGSAFSVNLPLPAVDAAPIVQPLAGRHVALLGEATLWLADMQGLLQRWGAQVHLGAPDPTDDALVRLGPGPLPAQLPATTVVVLDDGPLLPLQERAHWEVSAYASQALLAALAPETAQADEDDETVLLPDMPPGQRGRVLLVDDNLVNRELIQHQLETLGFAVSVAPDGAKAHQLWQDSYYDAVLTDLNMPGMDGYTLVRSLRADDPYVPILAVTASALADERQRCRAAGVTDLLPKPLTLRQLDQTLRRYLPDALDESATPAPVVIDGEVKVQMRLAFSRIAPRDLARLRAAQQQGDAAGMAQAVHSFSGALSMLDEADLASRCMALETALRAAGTPLPLAEVEALADSLAQLLEDWEAPEAH